MCIPENMGIWNGDAYDVAHDDGRAGAVCIKRKWGTEYGTGSETAGLAVYRCRETGCNPERNRRAKLLPASTFAFCLLGSIAVIYYNDEHLDTYEEGVQVTKIILCQKWEAKVCLEGSVIPAPYAEKVRMGEYDTIKAVVSRV